MTCFNKEKYTELKEAAKHFGDVHVVTDEHSVSVAYMPAIPDSGCRMLDVAVSYCSPNDTFKKKHGKYQALSKLANGEVIKMPLAKEYRDFGSKSMGASLLDRFSL